MKQSLEEKQTLAMEGLSAGKNCGQLVLRSQHLQGFKRHRQRKASLQLRRLHQRGNCFAILESGRSQ